MPEAEAQFVTFFVGDEEYAVDIAIVQEIIRMAPITRVPRTPAFVEGIINLRGKIVPVLDLRKRFDLPGRMDERRSRIIVVKLARYVIGLIVDGVAEVLRLPAASIEPPPTMVTAGVDTAFIKAVGKIADRLIILLDLERILVQEEADALVELSTEPTAS